LPPYPANCRPILCQLPPYPLPSAALSAALSCQLLPYPPPYPAKCRPIMPTAAPSCQMPPYPIPAAALSCQLPPYPANCR
ncbi:hypothetical protein T484DRAFT_1572842, partial [Baffinella frigidus]